MPGCAPPTPSVEAEETIDMPRGGARNRSGPQPDENSGRSERRGLNLNALPSEGYDGPMPTFPLPRALVWWVFWEGKGQNRKVDTEATETRRDRERELWEWAWRTPQACAWIREPWRWQAV